MPKDDAIRLHFKDGIAHVLVERPPVNAFDNSLIEELDGALTTIEQSNDVSGVLFRSGLKVFSAGADLEQIRDGLETDKGRDEIIDTVRQMQHVFARVENLDTVTIAEIAGAAVGGGLEFALCCDLRIASEKAKLGLPEAGLGLLPAAGGTQRLPRVCGDAVARRLILGGELIDGREALRLGLVHWAVPHDELAGRTHEIADRVAALPTSAVAACKRCIAAATDPGVDGFELELTETRQLHDSGEPAQRIEQFLARSG